MNCAMSNVLAVILAGGQGERLSILSEKRAKPAVPFAGKYRIIDFALSNCVNSGIYDIAVLTQYRPHSLHDHIGIGKPWDLDRRHGGVRLLQPFIGRQDSDWYSGTADAVYQNLAFIMESSSDYVLILAGDHIYRMDYRPMIAFHQQHGADVTLGGVVIPLEEGSRFGILETDRSGHVTAFVEKPPNPSSNLVSMGVYIFSWPALRDIAKADGDGNVLQGDVLAERMTNSYVRSEGRLVAAVGLDNVVVVATDDAVLVADANSAAEVSGIVAKLRGQNRSESQQHVTCHRPWGHYRSVDAGDRFQVKRITVKPGAKLSLQKHYHRAEHWVVVHGTAMVQRGEERMLVRENESVYIPIGTEHRLENPGKLPLQLIEVQSGPYLGEDDIVRVSDSYGRA